MGSIKHSEAPVNVFSGSTPALKEGTEGHSPSQTLHEGSSTKQTTHAPKQLSSLIPDELAAELERLEHDFEMQINSLDFVSIKDSADQQFVTNAGLPSGLRPASQHAASKVRSRKYKGAKDPATNESFDTAHGEVEKENPSVTNVTQTHPNGSESQSGFSELIKSIEGESASIQQSTESIALENLSELATPGSNHLPMDLNLQPTDETSATEAFSQKRSIKEEKKILDKATNDITARTETIVKTVKSKLAALQSSGNREFLIETLQRLEKTAVDLKAGPPREDALLTDSTHNFGVILGGARSEELDLFQLSNTGNMSFDFVITALHSDCSQPPQEDEHEEGFRRQPFTVTPEYGSIQPGQALNVTAYFQAKSSGIYHQKFVVMSGEDEVRSFVLSARVGNPYVTCSPVIINFGLISRGEEVSRPLELTNGGSYGGSWKLEFADDDDNDSRRNSFFKLTEKEGYLEAGASFTAYIVFTPSREGDFSCKLRMIRARDTVPIAVTGTGGGSRFELKFVEHVDAQFNGLDWGTCIIGNQYQKRFLLTNAGNIEGFADLLYPRDLFTYVVERNHRNLISVVNGEAKSIDVIFEPTQVETCKDNLQITQVNGSAVLLPFRFKSGVCSWNVDGDLNFVNMKSGTRAERGISVTNDGTLDVILSFKLTTPIALPKKYYDIVTNPIFSAGKALKPGQKVIFTIGVVPEEIGSFEGSFVLSTDLGKGLIERAFTYNFDTFKEEFVLNSDADESVGRIMMGHSAQISRTMTNFGNSDIKWRVLMNSVTIAGEPASDILRGWSIVGDFCMFSFC